MPSLRKFMSPVMSRYPPEGVIGDTVTLEAITVDNRTLCWLDMMLDGGLELPSDLWTSTDGSPSFVLLLDGAPGTGKTTFALELCYNLTANRQPHTDMPWSSLYVSTETQGNRILENATRYGWNTGFFNVLKGEDRILEWPLCNLLGREHFKGDNPSSYLRTLIKEYLKTFPLPGGVFEDVFYQKFTRRTRSHQM